MADSSSMVVATDDTGGRVFIRADVLSSPSRMNIAVTDGANVWRGDMGPEKKLRASKLSDDAFLDKLSALLKDPDNGGDLSLQLVHTDAGALMFNTVVTVDSHRMPFATEVTLTPEADAAAAVRVLIHDLMLSMSQQKAHTAAKQTEIEVLEKQLQASEHNLTRVKDAKIHNEQELVANFVKLLNAKKAEIARLQQQVDTLARQLAEGKQAAKAAIAAAQAAGPVGAGAGAGVGAGAGAAAVGAADDGDSSPEPPPGTDDDDDDDDDDDNDNDGGGGGRDGPPSVSLPITSLGVSSLGYAPTRRLYRTGVAGGALPPTARKRQRGPDIASTRATLGASVPNPVAVHGSVGDSPSRGRGVELAAPLDDMEAALQEVQAPAPLLRGRLRRSRTNATETQGTEAPTPKDPSLPCAESESLA